VTDNPRLPHGGHTLMPQPRLAQGTLNDPVARHPPGPLAAARGQFDLVRRSPQGQPMTSARAPTGVPAVPPPCPTRRASHGPATATTAPLAIPRRGAARAGRPCGGPAAASTGSGAPCQSRAAGRRLPRRAAPRERPVPALPAPASPIWGLGHGPRGAGRVTPTRFGPARLGPGGTLPAADASPRNPPVTRRAAPRRPGAWSGGLLRDERDRHLHTLRLAPRA
jgi:hypothetical protein